MQTPGYDEFRVSNFITPETVELDLKESKRDEILWTLVSKIPELKDKPELKKLLYDAVVERENLHTTGIGDGIALPHARNPIVGVVEKPVIVFARHPVGVNYGSIDNEPVRIFFLLVSPTVSMHLHMLARISRILRQPGIKKALLSADKPEKVIAAIKSAEDKLLK